jgi:hypothetical protein
MVAMVAVGIIVGINTRHLTPNLDPNDVVASAPLQGWYMGQLLTGLSVSCSSAVSTGPA